MHTYGEIASDIELDLKQVLDDVEVPRAQLYWWMTLVGNNLKARHISKGHKVGADRRRSGAWLNTFVLDIQTNTTNGRRYITLPRDIYDFDNDQGIDHLTYYTEYSEDDTTQTKQLHAVQFYRTSQRDLRTIQNSAYQRPSPKNPYYYRDGQSVYLTGIEESPDITKVEVGLYLVLPPILEVTDDTLFPFPEELVHILKRHILDLGRWNLLMPEEARLNDATARDQQTMQQAPPKTISVNDPAVQDEG